MQKIRSSFYIALFFVITFMPQCFAITKEGAIEQFKLYVQPVISLIIVIGLIYLVFGIYAKMNKYNFQKFSKSSAKSLELSKLTLVSHLPLGQNKSVDVVEINGKFLVLGVAGDNISLIKEFESEKEALTEFPQKESLSETFEGKASAFTAKFNNWEKLYKKYSKGENE